MLLENPSQTCVISALCFLDTVLGRPFWYQVWIMTQVDFLVTFGKVLNARPELGDEHAGWAQELGKGCLPACSETHLYRTHPTLQFPNPGSESCALLVSEFACPVS